MIRWSRPIVWGAATVVILLVGNRWAIAEGPAGASAPLAEATGTSYVAPASPAFSRGVSELAYTAPYRAYRRGTVPAFGVYVGPRAAYAGTLAPWGSIPARYYAASVPLAVYAAPSYGPSATLLRPRPEEGEPSAAREELPPNGPFAAEKNTANSDVEPIPAPQPFDVPSPEPTHPEAPQAEAGHMRTPSPSAKAAPGPSAVPASGPREF